MTVAEALQQLRSLRNHIQSCIHNFSDAIIFRKDILKEDEKENEQNP